MSVDSCTCDPNPGSTEGPEVDCPEHGIDAETVGWLHANGLCPASTPAEALALRTERTLAGTGNADLTEPGRYPARCSQCGQRWIDRSCGPTHAIIAARQGLNGLRIGLSRLRDAVTVEGCAPNYHREQKARLRAEWPPVDRALQDVLAELGEDR